MNQHTSFSRTLSDISSGDGSLSRVLHDSMQNSVSGFIPSNLLLPKNNSRTPNHSTVTPGRLRSVGMSVKKTPGMAGRKMPDTEGDRGQHDLARGSSTTSASQDECRPDSSSDDSPTDENAAVQSSAAGSGGGGDFGLATVDELSNARILRFKSSSTSRQPPMVDTKASCASPKQKATSRRFIPQKPEKVLDCPYIVDDFYLHNISWSSDNVLAVALNNEVYLWSAATGSITRLMEAGLDGEYITSIAWSPDLPSVIAVGSSASRVQLWNASTQSLLRTMRLGNSSNAASGRVPALAWCDHQLTSGSRSGLIRQHDTRVAHHETACLDFHSQEVCGLAWSPDKAYLAAGANDNRVSIWSASASSSSQPDVVLSDHQAAVKALAWCPWKPRLLATGGGCVDKSLKFWNASNGNCIKSVNMGAQVSGVVWNSEYREIITSHGDPRNKLIIWKYPDITMVTELMEHKARILDLVASPSGEIVASSSADETLCIWHCFQVDRVRKKAEQKSQQQQPQYMRTIR